MDKKRTEQIRAEFEAIESPNARFIDNQMYIAAQVQNCLERKGWTQKKLAEEAGLRPSQISEIISGEANPTLKTISALEDALCENVIVAPDFFMEELEEQGIIVQSISMDTISASYNQEDEVSQFVADESFSFNFFNEKKGEMEVDAAEDTTNMNPFNYRKAS
ncbi:MAG: hypothetical protein CL666_13875 [Balneola sp.]|nr:hypothetical protein [Balneola sp.]|tara:strand:+ start:12893 stop:13381 length:489 start_codon:yes stop_codon:yes gene_type:complete